MAFKRAKLSVGLPKEEIPRLWKQLPKEAKIYWEKEGKGWRVLAKKRDVLIAKTKNVMSSGAEETHDENDSVTPNLGFMRRMIN